MEPKRSVPAPDPTAPTPLFVDLDGTLITTDATFESFMAVLRRRPQALGVVFARARHGRAALKRALVESAEPNPRFLPYRSDVVEFLKSEKKRGRRLVLATASDVRWAEQVAGHLGIFDAVLGSDGRTNLKGDRKLEAIEAYCRQHEVSGFGYVGDSRADLPIWRCATEVLAVDPDRSLLSRLRQIKEPHRVFRRSGSLLRPMFTALRPLHWVKNTLVFAPVILAHEAHVLEKLGSAIVAFLAFSLCASGGYVLNDLLDIEADQRHPAKNRRPFASQSIPRSLGLPLIIGLFGAGAVLAEFALPASFLLPLVLYVFATFAYSLWLKSKPIVDVLILAGLHTLRILAGGEATGTAASEWLLAFSLFFFTSLAFAKRYSELVRLADEGTPRVAGRGYRVSDLSLLESLGPTSGYLAVLVLALYINSEKVTGLYRNPFALWLLCPLFLYWVSRVWLIAKRKRLSEDPVVFAVTDPVSLVCGGTAILLLVMAT